MNICATATFPIGPYTVQQRPRWDSPAWAQYVVYLGDIVIGKCFSRPCESDCRWLEDQQRWQTGYAYSSAPLPELTQRRYGNNQYRLGVRYVARKRGR